MRIDPKRRRRDRSGFSHRTHFAVYGKMRLKENNRDEIRRGEISGIELR
jgi:hypothetical protein